MVIEIHPSLYETNAGPPDMYIYRYSEKINAQLHHQVDLPGHLPSGSYILLLKEKSKIVYATNLQLISD